MLGLVSTIAGSRDGYIDAQVCHAKFSWPAGVAIDGSDNLYIADSGNNIICKITPNGMAKTFAGSKMGGAENGQGIAASFLFPSGLAVDTEGNVYVADTRNHMIRKITPDGTVKTLAGSTTAGSKNGEGREASFRYPNGVAVDSGGNIYVADTFNHMIRKITPDGTVTTLAGSTTAGKADGQGSTASFGRPNGVSVDFEGNVYVADTFNHMVRKITPNGTVTTLAGGSADGQGSDSPFNLPTGLVVDSVGNIYVADANSMRILKITPNGNISTVAGSSTSGAINGKGSDASFSYPVDIAIDNNGALYVADALNDLIRKIVPVQP